MSSNSTFSQYAAIRDRTTALIDGLTDEDCCVQSAPQASPVKWHLGHIAWFFESFVLHQFEKEFKPFQAAYCSMFSSYDASGVPNPDPNRGLFTRPSMSEIRRYCRNVDERMQKLLTRPIHDEMLDTLTILGMNHEYQHQELMLVDIKHLLSKNPLNPSYNTSSMAQADFPAEYPSLTWHSFDEGLVEIGYKGRGFSYDNESPRHKQYLPAYQLASRLVTNGEYLQFVEQGGYENVSFWLSEGWNWIKANQIRHPLYWRRNETGWQEFTLSGIAPLDLNLPVIHISYYEADAFARWSDARLPTEYEWENAANQQRVEGCFADNNRFHPLPANITDDNTKPVQVFGDAWEWMQSSYSPYPGYNPAKPNSSEPKSLVWDMAVGEYNSRSMVNQYVLRGGSCVTPQKWIRSTFRNFFPAETRIQFSGIRLARDVAL